MTGRMAVLRNLVCGAAALAAALALVVTDADARAGRGGSIGSRGGNTFSAPPATNTAPKPASPIDKTITQPGKSTATAGAATAGSATAAQASRFGGLKGILLGGLFGAALASLLGPGMLASLLGFMLWALLIGGAVMLVMALIRARSGVQPQPALAQAAGRGPAQPQGAAYRTAAGGLGGAGAALAIAKADYDAFERLLGEIQDAYGRGDVKALGERATPEMLSNFANELDGNAKQGVRNEVSGAKLLQGDLAEAWREGGGEYATVAMRYSLTDATIETATGRVVSGSRSEPQEVTEVWTFWRPLNGTARNWELSAIQQA